MAKVRVYELAKELDVESKTILTTLKDMGEFVRSASSTVEPMVERRLRQRLGAPPASRPIVAHALTSVAEVATTTNIARATRMTERPNPRPSVRTHPALDRPVAPRGPRRRHKGSVPEMVAIMLEVIGVTERPYEDEYLTAASLAKDWGELNCDASDVGAWRALGMDYAHLAEPFLSHGITAKLAQARPWHTNPHDPQQPTVLERVLREPPYQPRAVALRDAAQHLRLSGLMR